MDMPGRKWTYADYRYEFNSKEKDNEINSGGQNYGMRTYDKRLGRFFSADVAMPLYPHLSPYNFAANRPIVAIDVEGLQAWDAPNSLDLISKFSWQNFVKQRWSEALISKENNFDCADLAIEMLAGYHKKMGIQLIVKVFKGNRLIILDSNDPKYTDNAKKDAGGNKLTSYEYFLEDLKKWIGANDLAQKTIAYKIKGKELETGDLALYWDDGSGEYGHTQVIDDDFSEPDNGGPHGYIQSSGHYLGKNNPGNNFDNPQLSSGSANFNSWSRGLFRFNFLQNAPKFSSQETVEFLKPKSPIALPTLQELEIIIPKGIFGGGGTGSSGSNNGGSNKPDTGGKTKPMF